MYSAAETRVKERKEMRARVANDVCRISEEALSKFEGEALMRGIVDRQILCLRVVVSS